jgi:alcohol dehydrogenase class IV
VLGKPGATLRDLAEAVLALTTAVGVPTDLSAFDSAVEEIPALAESVVRDYPRPTNPVSLEADRLAELLKYLRVGDFLGAWTAMGDLA